MVYGMEWSIVLYNLTEEKIVSKYHFDGPTYIQFSEDGSEFVVTSCYGMAKVFHKSTPPAPAGYIKMKHKV